MYKVLMCGGREYWVKGPVVAELRRLIKKHGTTNLLVITGGAPGADTLAEVMAKEMDVHVARVDALWGTRHKSAGPQRNAVMLSLEPDEVIAFHENIGKSSGTKDMVKRAKKAGVPAKVRK